MNDDRKRKINMAYRGQKHMAKKRGIPFLFSRPEWIKWWEDKMGSEWLEKRGARRGAYVMARKLDKGPYAPWNVEAILHEENGRAMKPNGTSPVGSRNGRVKLTPEQVKEIYLSDDTQVSIARQYGITDGNVRTIRKGESWTSITSNLPKVNYTDHRRKMKGGA